jgi:hypothetical protein
MPAFKGKDDSGWKDTSAIYGKDATGWLYGKEAFAKNDAGWQRVWTDCRRHDAGGRDWATTTLSAVYSGSCGNRTYQIPTRYTKTGCPSYDVAGTNVSSPDCNKYDTNCYNAATGAYEYRNSCTSRESRIVYTFTAKSGTACGTQYAYTDWVSDPTCEGGCTTAYTATEYNYNGKMLYSFTEDGYYAAFFDNCAGCGGGGGCTSSSYYYLTVCGGAVTVNFLYCSACSNIFDGSPC